MKKLYVLIAVMMLSAPGAFAKNANSNAKSTLQCLNSHGGVRGSETNSAYTTGPGSSNNANAYCGGSAWQIVDANGSVQSSFSPAH